MSQGPQDKSRRSETKFQELLRSHGFNICAFGADKVPSGMYRCGSHEREPQTDAEFKLEGAGSNWGVVYSTSPKPVVCIDVDGDVAMEPLKEVKLSTRSKTKNGKTFTSMHGMCIISDPPSGASGWKRFCKDLEKAVPEIEYFWPGGKQAFIMQGTYVTGGDTSSWTAIDAKSIPTLTRAKLKSMVLACASRPPGGAAPEIHRRREIFLKAKDRYVKAGLLAKESPAKCNGIWWGWFREICEEVGHGATEDYYHAFGPKHYKLADIRRSIEKFFKPMENLKSKEKNDTELYTELYNAGDADRGFLVALTHAFCYGRPSGETAEHAIMRFNEYGIRTDVVKAERFLDELDLRGEEFIANLLVEIFADDHKQHVSFMYWYVAKNGLVKVTGMRDKDNVMLFGQSRYDGGLEWQEAEVQWQKMAGEYERFFGLPPTDSAAKSLERKINRSRRIRITNATDEKYWGSRTHLHFGFDMVHDMKTGRYEAIAPHHGYFTRHVRHLKKPADEKCWKMLQATTEIPEAVYRAIRIVVAEMPESGAGLADGQAKKNKEWNDRVVRVFIEKMALMFAGSRRYDAAGYEQLTYLFGPSGTGKSTVMELVEDLVDTQHKASMDMFKSEKNRDQFAMAQILNKMLVTSDELESDSTSESKLFKESMTAKGTAARQMHTTRQMPKWRPTYYVATSNKLIKASKRQTARRLWLVPVGNKVKEDLKFWFELRRDPGAYGATMTHLTCALLNICREILAGRCGHAAFTEEEVGTVYDRYSSGIIMKFIKEWFEPADYYGIRVTTMYKLFDQVHPNNVKTQKTFISIVDSNYGCKSSMRVVRSDRDRWKLEYVGGGISGPKMLPGYRIKPEKYEEILNDGMLPEVDRGDESGKKPNSTA